MDSLWKKALGAVVGSALANVGVWWIGVSTLTGGGAKEGRSEDRDRD